MARYIDKEKAKETLKHLCLETAYNSVGTVIGYPCDIYADLAENRIETWVDLIQTADVIEVVRCKDCKHYLNSTEKCGLIDTRLHFYETDKLWTEDCFCSWGERRDK